MTKPNKPELVRLITPKSVCHDRPKLIERGPNTGWVRVNPYDKPEDKQVIPTDNDSIIDQCATAPSDTLNQALASVASATGIPGNATDSNDVTEDAVSDLPICGGSMI